MKSKVLINKDIKAWVIGASAGGVEALLTLLPNFQKSITFPVVVVTHLLSNGPNLLPNLLKEKCLLQVKEAESCEPLRPGIIYLAPPDYHLSVEDSFTLSLSNEDRVLFSRPSIDLLFESAAGVYKEGLVGMLLTGANNDGARGMKKIQDKGGYTILQSPDDAKFAEMPSAALKLVSPDVVDNLQAISTLIRRII